MRFLADMGISPKTVAFLCGLGHDAKHLYEEGLCRASDEEITQKARREQRVLLTSDLGFGDLLAHSAARLPSVIIFRLSSMRPERVNAHLTVILERFSTELAEGAILSVTERRVRVRRLPIHKDAE